MLGGTKPVAVQSTITIGPVGAAAAEMDGGGEAAAVVTGGVTTAVVEVGGTVIDVSGGSALVAAMLMTGEFVVILAILLEQPKTENIMISPEL
jgi:hypothetical protein